MTQIALHLEQGAVMTTPHEPEPTIFVVDDDADVRRSVSSVLSQRWHVETASTGEEGLERMAGGEFTPDVVLLDIRMPGLDGYQVCARMQEDDRLEWIPVVFVTVLDSDKDRQRAVSVGGAAYLEKPFDNHDLIAIVEEQLQTRERWSRLRGPGTPDSESDVRSDEGPPLHFDWRDPGNFPAFRNEILGSRDASEDQIARARGLTAADLYALSDILHLHEEQLTRYLAAFTELPYEDRISADDVALGALPRAFCKSNGVVPLEDGGILLSNPFDLATLDSLERTLWRDHEPKIVLAPPDRIRSVFEGDDETSFQPSKSKGRTLSLDRKDDDVREEESRGKGQALANEILRGAVAEGASDIHIEPKEQGVVVRYRIDGDMYDIRTVRSEDAARVISRLKALGGLDIAERRKPQDGALRATFGRRRFKLRLATSSTNQGETLVIRLLEPDAEPLPLEELGMTRQQAETLRETAQRHQGMILVVGPTGSGKSTTIYTLLSSVDGDKRSLMSVEDPVEYSIEAANQQEVNVKAGVTFEALLKSAMRQDPDILFLGEIRDSFSANAALQFASSGHLTVSTLHAANATKAIFRLEQLGVQRGAMADALSVVVAQKLMKKLCESCKEVGPITDAEAEMLAPFTGDVPDRVARPGGCPACRDTGYDGREGLHELMIVDPEVGALIRDGASVQQVREFCRDRGDYLIRDHAVQKVRELTFPVADVYEQILAEEEEQERAAEAAGPSRASTTPARAPDSEEPSPLDQGWSAELDLEEAQAGPGTDGNEATVVLVVDDDPDMRRLVEAFLTKAGYQVVLCTDGVEALMRLGAGGIDLVLSDIQMPNMNGLQLLEMMQEKGIGVPSVFFTAHEDERLEASMLERGAADFLEKPVKKDVLLLRLKNALRQAAVG